MLKKLYGLFIYKLQFTSFFSIMERISGLLLLLGIYYFFFKEIFSNAFFYNMKIYFLFELLNLFLFLILLNYFLFHVLNGLRIYILHVYYAYNLNKNFLNLNLFYLFKILFHKDKLNKYFMNIFLNFQKYSNDLFVKSNSFFLFIIIVIFNFTVLILLA